MTRLNWLYRSLHFYRLVWLTAATGLVLTCALLVGHFQMQKHADQSRLQQITQQLATRLEQRIQIHTEILRGLQGTLLTSSHMERQTFNAVLEHQNILIRQGGFTAVALVQPVSPPDLPQFLASVHKGQPLHEAYQTFAMHPVTRQEKHQLLDYLYPVNTTTQPLLGYDLASSADALASIHYVQEEQRCVTTETEQASMLPGQPLTFMLICPATSKEHPRVSDTGLPPPSAVIMFYRVDQLMATMEPGLLREIGRLRLIDRNGIRTPQAYARSRVLADKTLSALPTSHIVTQTISLPGRQWQLETSSNTALLKATTNLTLLYIALVQCGMTLALCWLLWSHARKQKQIQQQIEQTSLDINQLEQQRQLLAFLVNSSLDLIVVRAPSGQVLYANPAAQSVFAGALQAQGAAPNHLLAQAELDPLQVPIFLETAYRSPDGSEHHYDVSIRPVFNELNAYVGNALLARDITTRYNLSRELHCSRDRLADLLDLSSDWFWEQDTEGRITHVSGGFFHMHEVNTDFFIGKTRWELASSQSKDTDWSVYQGYIERREAFRDFTYTVETGNHESFCVAISGKPVYDARGVFTGYRGIGRDITPVQRSQEALINEKRRIISTLESISDGVITADLHGQVDYINPVATALTGWEFEEAVGQPIERVMQVVEPDSRLPLTALIRQALFVGQSPKEFRCSILLNRFGMNLLVQEAAACIRDHQGQITGGVVVFRDQTNWSSRLGGLKPLRADQSPLP